METQSLDGSPIWQLSSSIEFKSSDYYYLPAQVRAKRFSPDLEPLFILRFSVEDDTEDEAEDTDPLLPL